MIDFWSYPNEKHTVTTKDGYILEIHRIPNPGQPPALLAHGVLSSSADYLVMGPNKSLSFLLHDQKYDVWLFNYRGNRYSRRHVSLNPDIGPHFWQYSMHEIAIYDLSATVDYIVSVTKHDRLYYTGHSMGTTIFWILLSEQPQYNAKFHFMQALAPVAFLGHIRSSILNNLISNMDGLEVMMAMNGMFEIMAHETHLKTNVKDICLASLQAVCLPMIEDVVGKGVNSLSRAILQRVIGHFPSGASLKQFAHVAQLARSKRFAKYDYGMMVNLQRYQSVIPPSYNLRRCHVPLVLHYGSIDGIVAVRDVEYLGSNLTSVVEVNEIRNYNHLDFLYSLSATDLLYDRVLKTFNEHRRKVGL